MFKRNPKGGKQLMNILSENYKIKEVESMIAGKGIAFGE
jgi:hypothetical protein